MLHLFVDGHLKKYLLSFGQVKVVFINKVWHKLMPIHFIHLWIFIKVCFYQTLKRNIINVLWLLVIMKFFIKNFFGA